MMKAIKLGIFFSLICLLLPTAVWAQYDDEIEGADTDTKNRTEENDEEVVKAKKKLPDPDKKFDRSRMFVGGFMGASFGDIVSIYLEPNVGYEVIEDRMQTGVGFIYQYTNYVDFPAPNKFSYYGGKVYNRVFVWEGLFVQLEYNVLNTDVFAVDYNLQIIGRGRNTYHTILGGGGYNVPMGDNSFFSIMVLTNLNTNLIYPDHDIYFNFGVGIGL